MLLRLTDGKKTILNILSLYLITSCVLLGIFFYSWYQKEKEVIIDDKILELRELSHSFITHLYDHLKEGEQDFLKLLEETSLELQIPFGIANARGNVLFSTLERFKKGDNIQEFISYQDIEKKHRAHNDKIIKVENDTFLLTQRAGGRFWRFVRTQLDEESGDFYKGGGYLIFKAGGIMDSLLALWIKMAFWFFCAVMGILAVAYFLVKLSLKPLSEKITSLNAFIKDSTHEINTPLSVILMSVERIKEEKLEPQDLQKFKRIKMAAKTLSQIYEDLVYYNFPHLMEGKNEKIDLKQLLSERVDYFMPFYQQKNIDFSANLQESSIVASRTKIARVVDNLLDNAFKYTNVGGKVHLNLTKNTLSVIDNGCGIKKEDQKRIFERYVRSNEEQGGFGIGLSIVKKICNAYKIEITCKSEVGKGSEFILKW
ncbi:two-component sensor histidine kinase [Helicobacter valdiviensis]|uniref:histidine kinase n=1 Tax=Helicobacter valdiviensis TaxID=1458358 RepID=A0A2W6MU09_9HELI|nr:HAMP domain-containing sensor histidine kinase [Helicobacter valdiviensis]PZT47937.1 two-component sensor histidine kinase [Helicobacter valdiviensis]